ncbi:hypothetical protein D915_009796 [Fasciola hepatica]|uniref:Uncharacterized protein n=1 Tax=Fasciola hepatica TaxID=6192 RepID=A0A4E0QYL3_FASHE|nr:hypothetical protein D915_009796 [Fasciola hepatica]
MQSRHDSDIDRQLPQVPSPDSKLNQELKLAKLKIKRLELELETAKQISDAKIKLAEKISDLQAEERSLLSVQTSQPTTPQPFEKLERVKNYVKSLPFSNAQLVDPISFKEPGIHVLTQE